MARFYRRVLSKAILDRAELAKKQSVSALLPSEKGDVSYVLFRTRRSGGRSCGLPLGTSGGAPRSLCRGQGGLPRKGVDRWNWHGRTQRRRIIRGFHLYRYRKLDERRRRYGAESSSRVGILQGGQRHYLAFEPRLRIVAIRSRSVTNQRAIWDQDCSFDLGSLFRSW